MSTGTEVSVAKQIGGMLTKMDGEFRAVLPDHITPEAFRRVAQTAIALNPQLQQCAPASIMAACTKAAECGLLPDGEQGAIIAYGSKATFLPMVSGLRELVRRSGQVKDWKVRIVHEGDEFEYVDGDEERLVHRPGFKEAANAILVYSIAYLANGEISRNVMRIDEVEAIRRRSRSGNSGPWVSDYLEMVKKTCLRRHYKSLPRAKDDLVRERMEGTIRAYDDATAQIDITPTKPTGEAPALTLQESSRAALAKAAELTAFDGETGEVHEPAQQTKVKGRRKTANERLAEAEAGRKGNGHAAPAAAPEKPSDTPAPQSEASSTGSDTSSPHADAYSHGHPHDDRDYEPGQFEPDEHAVSDEELEGEDPLELAYRQGWHGRFEMKVRTAPIGMRADKDRVEAYQAGWDAADKKTKIGNAPKNAEASEAMLDNLVSRVFI